MKIFKKGYAATVPGIQFFYQNKYVNWLLNLSDPNPLADLPVPAQAAAAPTIAALKRQNTESTNLSAYLKCVL